MSVGEVNDIQKITGKMPPQSIEAEEAVLGALLVNPNSITRIVETLRPQHFYKPAHREIFEAVLELFNKNEPVDIVTVSEHLRDKDKLEKAGGRSYINDLALAVVTTANIEYYAKIIADKSLLRELINAGSEIASLAYEDDGTTENTLVRPEKLKSTEHSKKPTQTSEL